MKIDLIDDYIIIKKINIPNNDLSINNIKKIQVNEIKNIDFLTKESNKQIDDLQVSKISKNNKLIKIFELINWYYLNLSHNFTQNWIKISIPSQFNQIINTPKIIENFKFIIIWDNPWKKEYENDEWFSLDWKAWLLLNEILQSKITNKHKDILFFNKTFISTTNTKDLFKIKDTHLVNNTFLFNAKILKLLGNIINIPLIVIWWQSERKFKWFFDIISSVSYLIPHTSYSRIFQNNNSIEWWNQKILEFKNKYNSLDILTDNWNISIVKIRNLGQEKKYNILNNFVETVILGNKTQSKK